MRYPFVKQEGNKDCAVATLSMIIRYYKGYVAHEQLRDMLNTNTSGTSAYNIIRTAEYYGFEAKGIKTEKLTFLNFPCIAYVTINKQLNHYIVIYKIDFKKQEIIIGDPATRLQKMKISEFVEITNNVYILFNLQKKLPYLEHKSITEFIINFLKNNKKVIIKIALISFFINIFVTITSFSFKFIVESIDFTPNLKYLYFIIFLLITILKITSTYFRNQLIIYLDKNIDFDLTNECYQNIIHFPYIYYCNRSTGEIISRINDLQLTKNFVSKIIVMVFSDLPLIFISGIIMFSLSTKLTIITILILILYFLIIKIFRNPLKIKIQEYQELRAKNTSFLVESISAYECIKGINIEKEAIMKFKRNYYEYVNNISDFSKVYNWQTTLKDAINDMGSIFIILLGCLEIGENLMTMGTLISFMYLVSNFSLPIKELLDTNVELEESLNSLKRVLELNYQKEKTGIIEKMHNGDINISNLNYAYNDEVILKNINISIKKGEKVLILGPSGSGKSTILKIIKKYLKIKNEKVIINSIDINDYSKNAIDSKISYIAQNERLFTDSLLNNLKLGRNIDNQKILEISKICKVDQIIKDNSFGFNMLIEEDGFNLSGGERQRIVLARTLLSDFEILLIDEGTNQLDISLERKILKDIFKKYYDKTIIVVSHRNNNLDLFDHLINIEEGVITEDVTRNK